VKKSYRIAQEKIYTDALAAVKVKVKKVTAHRDGSATIPVNEKSLPVVKGLANVEILAEGKTEMTIRIPAAVRYHNDNPPLLTEAERDAQKAEAEKKRAERAANRKNTVEVEFEENEPDAPAE